MASQQQPRDIPKSKSKSTFKPLKSKSRRYKPLTLESIEEEPTVKFPMIEALKDNFSLTILYSGKVISPETKLLIKQIENQYQIRIRIYTLGNWHSAFEEMHNFIHKFPLNTLKKNEKEIEDIIHNLAKRTLTENFEVFKAKSKSYFKLGNTVPQIKTIAETPPMKFVSNVDDFLKSKYINPPHIHTDSLIEILPGCDGCPDRDNLIANLKKLSQEERRKMLLNGIIPDKLQETTGLDTEDIEKSIHICSNQHCTQRWSVSSVMDYFEHIDNTKIGLYIPKNKLEKTQSANKLKYPPHSKKHGKGFMDDISKILYVICPDAKCKTLTSWHNGYRTWFAQIISSSKTKHKRELQNFDELGRKYTMIALSIQFPLFIAYCPKPSCKYAEEGYYIINKHHKFCIECNFHHNQPCNNGVNMVYCAECNRRHSIELHKGECPDIKCATKVCAVCKLGGDSYHSKKVCKGLDSINENDPDLEAYILTSNGKRCPNLECRTYIEQSDGCNHMTCSKCKTDFCYRCGNFMGKYNAVLLRYDPHGCVASNGAVAGRLDPHSAEGQLERQREIDHELEQQRIANQRRDLLHASSWLRNEIRQRYNDQLPEHRELHSLNDRLSLNIILLNNYIDELRKIEEDILNGIIRMPEERLEITETNILRTQRALQTAYDNVIRQRRQVDQAAAPAAAPAEAPVSRIVQAARAARLAHHPAPAHPAPVPPIQLQAQAQAHAQAQAQEQVQEQVQEQAQEQVQEQARAQVQVQAHEQVQVQAQAHAQAIAQGIVQNDDNMIRMHQEQLRNLQLLAHANGIDFDLNNLDVLLQFL